MLHHKIASKAKASGVTIEETTHNGEISGFVAVHEDSGCQVIHKDAKHALAMCLVLKSVAVEYPSVLFTQLNPEHEISYVFRGQASVKSEFLTIHEFTATEAEKLRDECFEAIHKLADMGVDVEGQDSEDEEDKPIASVVPVKYREIYKLVSDGSNCGDWLAVTLNAYCKEGTGKRAPFLINVFQHILELNGVDLSGAWVNNRNSGWQGRFRMTGRNMLTKAVARRGQILLGNPADPDTIEELTAPSEWVEKNSAKPKTK